MRWKCASLVKLICRDKFKITINEKAPRLRHEAVYFQNCLRKSGCRVVMMLTLIYSVSILKSNFINIEIFFCELCSHETDLTHLIKWNENLFAAILLFWDVLSSLIVWWFRIFRNHQSASTSNLFGILGNSSIWIKNYGLENFYMCLIKN